jgi:DNA-binding CsgD family transcriptional regulator
MAQSMFLVEYSENNNAFIKKLDSLKKNLNSDNQMHLNEIIQEHRTEHFKKNWKEFESSFLEVHPEFYKKLHINCPALSPAELKLAALIHLGLSSKQIGSITSGKPESVDVARSRLRTKLGLLADTNLRTFFLNL